MANAFVIAGPKLQKKLRDLSNDVTNVDLTPTPNVSNRQEIISRRGTGSGKTSSYNGYFTLKDVSTYNEDGTVKEYRVAVCDGETWNPETETSSSMPVYVNDYVVAHFECCVFSIPENTDISIAICVIDKDYDISRDFHTSKIYDISKYGYGNYAICIVAIPDVHVPNVYAKYLIGERDLYYSDKFIQRHIVGMGNGIPRVWLTYYDCQMEVDDDNITNN